MEKKNKKQKQKKKPATVKNLRVLEYLLIMAIISCSNNLNY